MPRPDSPSIRSSARHTLRALLGAAALLATTSGRGLTAPAPARAPSPAVSGRLEGIVTVSSALVARRPRFRIYDDAGAPPEAPPLSPIGELANVVIYIERADGAPVLAPTRAALEQRDERFQPRVVVIPAHSTVDFPNRDRVFHNVFSLSRAATFDLGRYPRDASKSVQFDRAGVVRVFCHIHADMSAAIVVVDGPGYAVPDSTGRYTIDALPPGDYDVVGWHERSDPVRRRVHVDAGATTRLDLRIPIADAPRRDR